MNFSHDPTCISSNSTLRGVVSPSLETLEVTRSKSEGHEHFTAVLAE